MKINDICLRLNKINSLSHIKRFPLFQVLTNSNIYSEYIFPKTDKKVDFEKLNKCSGLKIKTTFSREDIYYNARF